MHHSRDALLSSTESPMDGESLLDSSHIRVEDAGFTGKTLAWVVSLGVKTLGELSQIPLNELKQRGSRQNILGNLRRTLWAHGLCIAEERSEPSYYNDTHRRLFETFKNDPDPARRMRALSAFVSANEDLAWKFANGFIRKHGRHALDEKTLIQAGRVGLFLAAERWNPHLGYRFSTYAHWWIRHAIRREYYRKGRGGIGLQMPHFETMLPKFLKARQYLQNREGIARPALREVLRQAEMTVEAFESMYAAVCVARGRMKPLASSAFSYDEQSGAYSDTVAMVDGVPWTPQSGMEPPVENAGKEDEEDRHAHFKKLCETARNALGLTDRERDVVFAHFGLDNKEPRTLEEIGRTLGITREAIRQIKVRAFRKLRNSARFANLPKDFLKGYGSVAASRTRESTCEEHYEDLLKLLQIDDREIAPVRRVPLDEYLSSLPDTD